MNNALSMGGLHTGGDLYWWVTHGITNSPMPAFDDVLTDDERWDTINFLGAFSVGYQGRVIEPEVQHRCGWPCIRRQWDASQNG